MAVVQRIINEIAEGRLPPGSPLPREREMLDQYGVARGTLRESLRFLEIQGVITIKPGRTRRGATPPAGHVGRAKAPVVAGCSPQAS
jgi:DNA-binding FadR family transcriptional regulator